MISIVIPAFNEENTITKTIEKIKEVLIPSGIKEYEIIIVDDGSSDKTSELVQNSGAILVKHPHNIGYGNSLKSGIRKASFDTIIITDADDTYPLDRIPVLLKEYKNGFNMVVGKREGKNYEESFFKKILRSILKKLVEFTAGRKIPDVNSGLRVFSKKEVIPYFNTLCDGFSFTTSLTLAYMMTGKFVKYIPISYNRRRGKSKVHLLRDSLRTAQFIVEAILYYNPIKIFLFFSLTLIICALINFCFSFIWKLTSTYTLGIGCILLSILMFGIGLLAVLLKQIMHSNKTIE